MDSALGAQGSESHRFIEGYWMAEAIPIAARLKFGDHRCAVRRDSIDRPTRYPSHRTLGYVMVEPGNTHFFALSPQDGGVSILLLDSLHANPLVAPLEVTWDVVSRERRFRYVLWEI